MGSEHVTVRCRLSRCIPSQTGKVSPRRDLARLGLCLAMWTPSEPPAPLVRLFIVCILPADVLLISPCSQAGSALLISSWNMVMLHFFARLSDRNAAGHKPQHEARVSDYPVYKQAKLCKCAQACSSRLAPTLQMCYDRCHLCAVRGEKCHYSISSVASNVCCVLLFLGATANLMLNQLVKGVLLLSAIACLEFVI